MKLEDAVADIRERMENGRPIPRITIRALLEGYEGAADVIYRHFRCKACKHAGENLIACPYWTECQATKKRWEWRGPEPGGEGASHV